MVSNKEPDPKTGRRFFEDTGIAAEEGSTGNETTDTGQSKAASIARVLFTGLQQRPKESDLRFFVHKGTMAPVQERDHEKPTERCEDAQLLGSGHEHGVFLPNIEINAARKLQYKTDLRSRKETSSLRLQRPISKEGSRIIELRRIFP